MPRRSSREDVPGVRRDIVVRINNSIRERLDTIADTFNLISGSGVPKDAELVRIIMISVLSSKMYPTISVIDRTVIALYVNSTMAAYGEAASWVSSLRLGLAQLAQDVSGAGTHVTIRETLPVRGRIPGHVSDRNLVHVKFDDVMRDMIKSLFAAIRNPLVARSDEVDEFLGRWNGALLDNKNPESQVVKEVLREFDACPEDHISVIEAYARYIDTLRSVVSEAMSAAASAARAAIEHAA